MHLKRILLSGILTIFAYSVGYAQITTSHAAQQVEKEETVAPPFDSTRNFLGNNNVKSYIGQLLYVNGLPEGDREYGYRNFKTQKEPRPVADEGRYGHPATKITYNTKYEDLFGKYFLVLDVQPDSSSQDPYSYEKDTWWFLLQNKDNESDTVWFKYSSRSFFPFITVSHFNYLKEKVVGKKYYSSYTKKEDGTIKSGVSSYDFYSGESFSHSKSDLWECIDVTIEDKNYHLVLIVKNQHGNVGTVQSAYLRPLSNGRVFLFSKEEYDRLCQKYGVTNMDAVRQNLIREGMAEELLIMSWGKPNKINRSSSGDQWVYNNQYVYVKGGKITGWN